MSQTAVLVWLSAASVLPTFRADLAGFAQSRFVRLEAPHENAAAYRGGQASAYAPDAVAQVESSLEEARNAAASLEQSRALAALERADQLLREHPELPQSAWLMAEVLQLSAEVESSAPDGAEAASTLRQRAAALEGPRAAPFSDRAPPSDTEAEPAHRVRVEGLEASDALEWDGRQTTSPVSAVTGEHHARVARNGRLLWAGWVNVSPADERVHLPVPETIACSTDDLNGAHFAAGRALPAAHARCDSYVLARARPSGGIEAALCDRQTCGNVVLWEHLSTTGSATSPTLGEKKTIWPYAIAGAAGAIALTGLVLWRAGVFDRAAASTSETWVFNGQKQQMGLSF
jgi:hypothetical protein